MQNEQEKSLKQRQQTYAYQADKLKANEAREQARPATPRPNEEPIPKIKIKRAKQS